MSDLPALTQRLQVLAREAGMLDLCIADLTAEPVHRALLEQGGQWLAEFPRGLTLAFPLLDGIVDELPARHREPGVARAYDVHAYQTITTRLEQTALSVAAELEQAGYRSVAVPTSLTLDGEAMRGHVSHKLVAHLGGMGWIGRSCLLVTRTHGPRVRLATVLTTAPLPPTASAEAVLAEEADACGSCTQCVEECPAGAFSGRPFHREEGRELRLDHARCVAYRDKAKEDSGVTICGVCVAVCPWGA